MLFTVIGNRPQMIKMAPVSAEIVSRGLPEYIVHTNQHYDHAMSGVFFEQLRIPAPSKFLSIEGRTHGRMTAEMLMQLEALMLEMKPKAVLVYGDTNSTLAAVLSAAKLNIPIAHIEAGPRTGDMTMPEEVNRIPADHLSSLRFCTDEISVANLKRENITDGVHLVGDLMYDAFVKFKPMAEKSTALAPFIDKFGGKPFVFMTIHRPVNTDTKEALEHLCGLIAASPLPVLFAVHPRTKAALEKFGLYDALAAHAHVALTPPLAYFDTMAALLQCAFTVTDSGGLQKESYWAGKKSFLAQNISPWPQLSADGWVSCIGSFDKKPAGDLWATMVAHTPIKAQQAYFGDGNAAKRIIDVLQANNYF